MLVNELKLQNFRCYEFLEFPVNKGITLVYGENGSGKSSIIEAFYFALSAKSFRSTDLNNLIKEKNDLTQTFISFNDTNGIKITKKINEKCRILEVNTKKTLTYSQLIANYPTCLVENKEFFFTSSSPEEKRAYLNKILFYVEQENKHTLNELKKTIYQRAACLKIKDYEQISYWDKKLIELEPKITKANSDIVDRINYLLSNSDIATYFSNKNPWINKLSLKFEPGYDSKLCFSEILTKNIEKDIILKRTSSGPHKRTFKLDINNKPADQILSRGQQKIIAIILHLIQRELIKSKTELEPIVLMDDISSELDNDNCNLMLKYLLENSIQTIMTSIENTRFINEKDIIMFHVEQKGDKSNVR